MEKQVKTIWVSQSKQKKKQQELKNRVPKEMKDVKMGWNLKSKNNRMKDIERILKLKTKHFFRTF